MIIPIIQINEDKKEIVATAFIINSLIITVAHTFFDGDEPKKNTQFVFKIGEIFYPLGVPIHKEYKELGVKYAKNDDVYEDILIFHLPTNIEFKSPLTLSTNYFYNSPVSLKGFPDSSFEVVHVPGIIINRKFSFTHIASDRSNFRYFNNCFLMDTTVDEGFSGGPVLKENEVYGMIVFGPQDKVSGKGCTAIKAEYIMKIIEEVI